MPNWPHVFERYDMLQSLKERYPLTNDITTTPDDPPLFEACAEEAFNRGRKMKFRAHRQRVLGGALVPLQSDLQPDQLFERALAIAKSQPRWRLLHSDLKRGRIEAVVTSTLLRFRDDVVIEIRGSEVHVRSKSRMGARDFGANEQRIRAFLEEFAS